MKTQVSRYAFIHAKMHGIMAKSCFDERLRFLLKMTSLLELSNALFPGAGSSGSSGAFGGGGEGGSDRELVHDVQRKFEKSIVKTLVRLLSFFREPPPLLVHVLREYDYRNFLALVRGKNSGVQTAGLWDTGKYALLPPDAGENFPASLANTPFEKYAALSGVKPLSEIEFEVDRQYYEELAACALALPSGEASRVRPLLEAEIVLRNLVWALR
ncbi:MAG: V-type ATPase subunit, partial [Spirochaetales bacterium]|nr:V-type ATPase subunit [Spirochaetales bacterium]